MKHLKLIITSFIVLLVILCGTRCCTVIDSGEIGIEFHKWSTSEENYGGVEGTCHGWVFYNPFTTSIFTYPTYIQRKTYDPFNVNARDASIFSMDPTIAYRINPDKACDIFSKRVISAPASTRHTAPAPISIRAIRSCRAVPTSRATCAVVLKHR